MRRQKSGFTLVELLVAMAILVIAFGLVTFLYTRAVRVRKIVVVTSEIQQVLSQMVDTLTYGDKRHWGIIHATGLNEGSSEIACYLANGAASMTAEITGGTITVTWGSEPPVNLDPNNKVEILTDSSYPSRFEYIDASGNRLDPPFSAEDAQKVTFVKIVLWARSTDPSMMSATPVPLVTGVRLRGRTSF